MSTVYLPPASANITSIITANSMQNLPLLSSLIIGGTQLNK